MTFRVWARSRQHDRHTGLHRKSWRHRSSFTSAWSDNSATWNVLSMLRDHRNVEGILFVRRLSYELAVDGSSGPSVCVPWRTSTRWRSGAAIIEQDPTANLNDFYLDDCHLSVVEKLMEDIMFFFFFFFSFVSDARIIEALAKLESYPDLEKKKVSFAWQSGRSFVWRMIRDELQSDVTSSRSRRDVE